MKVSPAVQAANLIRYIGDKVAESGESIEQLKPEAFYKEIGSPSAEFAVSLLSDLCDQGVIKTTSTEGAIAVDIFLNVSLTLEGWQEYEAEKRGQISGDYGFLAMEFGDSVLEAFAREVVKPTVKKELGYDLVDMRDKSETGVIDVNMRIKIRDAAFVIADLTHDNRGAYWEAGFAEGLHKPVVYICEQQKFERGGTHFDTNHCTTIPWSSAEKANHDAFKQTLINVLRNSLHL